MLPLSQPLQQVVVVHPVGHAVCHDNALFPRARKFRDVPFALLFVACAGVLAYMASTCDLREVGTGGSGSIGPEFKYIPGIWAVGLCTGTLVGVLFVLLLRCAPKFMVWTCLLTTPTFLVLLGLYFFHISPPGTRGDGFDFLPLYVGCWALAGLSLCFVACYKRFIPMTAEVLQVVAHVLLHHLGMLLIGLFTAVLHLAWVGCVALAMIAILDKVKQDQTPVLIGFFFVATWGMVVFRNLAYLSYCGVFAQWYFGERVSTLGSFAQASTKSFGAVCFGSLLIAVISTLRYIARSGRGSKNVAVKIVAMVVECLLACVQGMVEWFSSFAYVQVALRGCGFCDAARATVHLCTGANVGKICAAVLSGSVTFSGCLVSGVAATLAAGAYAHSLGLPSLQDAWNDRTSGSPGDAHMLVFWACAYTGSLCFGFFSAGNVMKIVEAGVNSILVCWAERPFQLATSHPEVHAKFMGISGRDLSTAPGIAAAQPALY